MITGKAKLGWEKRQTDRQTDRQRGRSKQSQVEY